VAAGSCKLPHGHLETGSAGLPAPDLRDGGSPNLPVVPKVRVRASGSRWAATDRRRDLHDPWRTVADRRKARALTPSFACRFPMILPDLYRFDVQPGRGSWDLTRKRSQVQTLSRPPYYA
jgi:hypothetical protein